MSEPGREWVGGGGQRAREGVCQGEVSEPARD